jgi:hypothetical protein
MSEKDHSKIRWTGVGLVAAFVTLLGLLLAVVTASPRPVVWLAAITPDQQVLFAVLLAGALGGCMHVGTSFADYVGNGKYQSDWQWWYTLRPFIGSALALVFLCLVKAGWLPVGQLKAGADGTMVVNVYAMTALGVLVGMFSKQAIDKLDNAFDTLLHTRKDDERKAGLQDEPAVPSISLAPAEIQVGSAAQDVTVTGKQLPSKPAATFDGRPRALKPGSDGAFLLSLLPEDFANAGEFDVRLSNGDGPGASAKLRVVQSAPVGKVQTEKIVTMVDGKVETVEPKVDDTQTGSVEQATPGERPSEEPAVTDGTNPTAGGNEEAAAPVTGTTGGDADAAKPSDGTGPEAVG